MTGPFGVAVAVLVLCSALTDAGPYLLPGFSVPAALVDDAPANVRPLPELAYKSEYPISTDGKYPTINFIVDTPANVFVSYAPNASADNTTFGVIKVWGTTFRAAANVEVQQLSFDSATISINTVFSFDLTPTAALLIEIQLYQKQVVKEYELSGTGTSVLSENVVYASANVSAESKYDRGSLSASSSSKLFVVDSTATISTDLEAYGMIQVEVAGFNMPEQLEISLSDNDHDVTVFADKLTNVTLKLDKYSIKNRMLCVATKTPVFAASRLDFNRSATPVATEVLPAGASCVMKPVPERVPGVVRPDVAAAAAANSTRSPLKQNSADGPSSSLVAVASAAIASVLAIAVN